MPIFPIPLHPPFPTLNKFGALASRLVHDLANHLCIISGNATSPSSSWTTANGWRGPSGPSSKPAKAWRAASSADAANCARS